MTQPTEPVEVTQLAPCPNPWCNTYDKPLPAYRTRSQKWVVQCGCGVCTFAHHVKDDAIAEWNHRAPARSEWRDIASAPRDGRPKLLTDGEVVQEGYWVNEGGGFWRSSGPQSYFDDEPTHWMPLPAPPTEPAPPARSYVDGYIPHDGGPCPVARTTEVEGITLGGATVRNAAYGLRWTDNPSRIVAYRPIRNMKDNPDGN